MERTIREQRQRGGGRREELTEGGAGVRGEERIAAEDCRVGMGHAELKRGGEKGRWDFE